MKSPLCHFIIKLEPGNYTVMPVILEKMRSSFVYLFGRGDGQNIIEKLLRHTSIYGDERDVLSIGCIGVIRGTQIKADRDIC